MTAFGVPAQTSTLLSLKGDSAVTHEPSPFNQAPWGAKSIDVISAKQNSPCQCSGRCLLEMRMCRCYEALSNVSLLRFLFMFLTVRVDKSLANTKIRLSVQVQSLSYQQLQQIWERREDQRRGPADAPCGLWIRDRQQSLRASRGGERGGVKASNRSRRGKQVHWKNKPAERITIDNGRKEVWLASRARKRDQRLHGKWINKLMKTSAVRWNRNQYFTISIQNTLQWRGNGYSVPCSGPVRSRILRKTAERVRKRSHVGWQ